MARRIRSIKPEILDDGVTAALPHLEWRLFVSLWLLADDYGNLHGHVAQVKGAALWRTGDTEDRVREALARLSADSLIQPYTVRGQDYVHILGWSKHQKVDHPGKALIPGPDQADSNTCDPSRNSRENLASPRENLAPDQDQDQDQDPDQDREQGESPATPALVLSAPEPAKPDPVADLWAEQERLRAEAIPSSRALKLSDDRRRKIAALLKAGYSADDLRACLTAYATEARSNGGEWFNGESNWVPANVARTLGRIGTRAAARAGPAGSSSPPPRPLRGAAAAFANLEPEAP